MSVKIVNAFVKDGKDGNLAGVVIDTVDLQEARMERMAPQIVGNYQKETAR